MKSLIPLFLLSFNAFAIGFIELSKEERASLESKVKQELHVKKATVQVSRLGGNGLKTYNFLFGKLSSREFSEIAKYFSYKTTPALPKLKYDAVKEYELIDFLLPKMQATIGNNFSPLENIPGTEALGNGEPLQVDLSMNCWATTFDILRSNVSPTVSYLYTDPDSVRFAKLLRDPRYSKLINMNEIRPYDYVLYLIKNQTGEYEIDHAATTLGMNLVFEKTGPTNIDYYQISPLDQVNKHRVDMNSNSKIMIEYRRLVNTFPDPLKLWGAKAKDLLLPEEESIFPKEILDQIVVEMTTGDSGRTYNRIRPIHLVKNTNKRYSIDSNDPITEYFRGSSIVGVLSSSLKGFSDPHLGKEICTSSGDLIVNVESAVGNSFKVHPTDYQMIDEDAKCIDSNGLEVKEFWMSVTVLKLID